MANPTHQTDAAAVELAGVDVPTTGDANTAVVRGVNWAVRAGERWLVAGPPGAGKSGLLGVAAGLVRPLRGTHRLFGADLSRLRESEQIARRSRLGVVFGGGGRLFNSMTLVGNVALPVRYHRREGVEAAAARVARVLEDFDLEGFAGRRPREVPRRVLQRAAMARALVLGPEVLLLDDPAGGLSPDEVHWWQRFLERRETDLIPATLVLAATDPRPWVRWANRFACLDSGELRVVEGAREMDRWLLPALSD